MSDLTFGIKINLDTKQGQTNLQGFEAAFNRALRTLGKSPDDIKAIRTLIDGARKGTVAVHDLDAATTKLIKDYSVNRKVADARDLLGLRDHAAIVRDINGIRSAYTNLKNSGVLTGRELAQANLAMRDQIRALKAETNGWTDSLHRARGELATAAVAIGAVGYVLGAAGKKSAEFSKGMAEVSTLLDDTKDMGKMTQAVRDLSRAYGSDVNKNAKALYDIISAGATDSSDAITELTAANKLAIGGVTDVSTAADGLTSILNAYGKSAKDAGDISDALFIAVKQGKTTIPELSQSIGQVAPIAATAGVGIDTLLSSIAALTASGTKTPEAITGIRSAIANIIQPSAQAQKLAKELGIEFDAQALKAKGLQGFLNDVARATGGNIAQMSQLFGSVEGLNAALSLTGAGAGKFSQTLDLMANKAGATDAAVAKMMDSDAAKIAKYNAAINDLQISIGQGVTAFTPLLEGLTALLNAFNGLPAPIRTTIATLGVLTLSLGALAVAAGPVGRALGTLKIAAKMLGPSLGLARAGSIATAGGIKALGAESAAALPAMRLLTLLKFSPWVGLALTVAHLYQAKKAADEAYAAMQKAKADKVRDLKTTADINASGEGAAVATKAELEKMNAYERANYAERLAQAQKFYAAKVELATTDKGIDPAQAKDNLEQKHKYDQALADLKTYQSDRSRAETDFNTRLNGIKTAQTKIITDAIADQLRKYQNANKALADLQKQRADIEAKFQQSADNLGKAKTTTPPGIVDVQAAVQKAQGLQQDGDMKGAAAAAEQARQLIDAANAAGTVSDYFLKDFLSRAKDVALAANQGQQTAVQNQIDGYKASIEALKSAADWMKQLTIGYDIAAASKSTDDLQAQLQALMAQNPLIQKVVLQKPDAADKNATDIVNQDTTTNTPGVPGFATGGLISGPGTGTSDSILARLSAGEFVQKNAAVRYYGVDFMHALNNLALPKFANGGLIGNLSIPSLPALPAASSGAATSNGDTLYLTIGGQQFGPVRSEPDVTASFRRAAALFGGARR